MTGENLRPLIVILGPTAVGKTGLALDMAEALDGAIVGADSRQVYRYMDVGTAKPTSAQQARVPHYVIDVIEPDDNLTLSRYQKLAYEAIDTIHAGGGVPLLVGGTGQYITAVLEGWSIPEVPPNEALRAELEQYAKTHGAEALHSRLVVRDAEAAVKIHPNNVRRVIRALEVCLETGEKISDLQRKQPPLYTTLELGLTMERQRLYERADSRVDKMVDAGLLQEVHDLLSRGYARSLPSMSGLGYAQFAAYLAGECGFQEAIEDTKIATHDFIRRQYTWFRKHDSGVLWHNVEHMRKLELITYASRWLTGQRT